MNPKPDPTSLPSDALRRQPTGDDLLAFVEEHIAAHVEIGDEFGRGWNAAMHNIRNRLLEVPTLLTGTPLLVEDREAK
jgi:hypothetical protein